MIVLNCMRIRKLMEEKGLDIETIKDQFDNKAHEVYPRLQNLYHCSFIEDRYPDSFVLTLASILDCSVDYILGFSDNIDGRFIPINVENKKSKEEEVRRLIVVYAERNNINLSNTNVLAYKTNIDRDIFEYLLKKDLSGESWILSSYYVISRLANTLGFDYASTIEFLFDVDSNEENKAYANYLVTKYIYEYEEG